MQALRRSPLSAAAALRQLVHRSGAAGAHAKPALAADVSSLDLGISPPSRVQQIAAKTRPAVACSSTRDPMQPDLLAAQAKDAALLAKVAEDILRASAGNWQVEVTSVKYAQALEPGRPLDLDYLASLALARGSAMA